MEVTVSFAGLTDAVAAAVEHWSAQNRAFCASSFFSSLNGNAGNIVRHVKAPCHSTVLLWVKKRQNDEGFRV
jgi:hypothetical protein